MLSLRLLHSAAAELRSPGLSPRDRGMLADDIEGVVANRRRRWCFAFLLALVLLAAAFNAGMMVAEAVL